MLVLIQALVWNWVLDWILVFVLVLGIEFRIYQRDLKMSKDFVIFKEKL